MKLIERCRSFILSVLSAVLPHVPSHSFSKIVGLLRLELPSVYTSVPQPKIPYDVQLMIIEWVYYLSQAHVVDHRTLAAMSTVCTEWTFPAQRLLFRRMPDSVHGRSVIGPFWRALQQHAHLGRHVLSLTVDTRTRYHLRKGDADSNAFAWLDVLRQCPNIVEIIFVGPEMSAEWGTADVLAQLRAIDIRPTVLNFAGIINSSSAIIHALMRLWDSVGFIFLNNNLGPVIRRQPPSGAVWGVNIPCHVDFNYLDRLPSTAELRELEIVGPYWPSGDLRREVAARIRSLTTYGLPPSRALVHFTRIEQLAFKALPKQPITFPTSIQHIVYLGEYRVVQADSAELQHLVTALSMLPNLRVFTATHRSSKEVLRILEIKCRLLEIEFVVYPDAESVPRARYIDWI